MSGCISGVLVGVLSVLYGSAWCVVFITCHPAEEHHSPTIRHGLLQEQHLREL